jgi:predicted nucleotidyltransferase
VTLEISSELDRLVTILVDWAAPATSATVYLYGSRVRGEHRPNSDVDIAVDWGNPAVGETVNWWTFNNEDEFRGINAKLPGPLQVLEPDDTEFQSKVRSGRVVYRRGNVACVWLRSKE